MFSKINEMRTREEGFTLIELLVATVVFSIVCGFAIPSVISRINIGKDMAVQHNTTMAAAAIIEYTNDHQELPASLGDTKFSNWDAEDTKVNAVIKKGKVCVTGWNNKGGSYSAVEPYILFDGEVSKTCDF